MIMTRFLTLFFAVLLIAAFSVSSPPSHGLLLVANKGDRTLGLIDPTAARQIATVAEGGVTGHEGPASADGKRAFVPIYGDSGVGRKHGAKTLAVIPVAGRVQRISISPDSRWVFTSDEEKPRLAVI